MHTKLKFHKEFKSLKMRNMNSTLLILAAGASSRMKQQSIELDNLSQEELQQSNTRSKGLISIDNSGRPLLDYLLFNAKKAGYSTIYIITGVHNSLFKSFYGAQDNNNEYNGLTIHFAIQHIPNDRTKPLGTADAVYQALEQYPNLKSTSFTVCNSDNLYSIKALELVRLFKKSPNALLGYRRKALQFSEDKIARFAVMNYSTEGYLEAIIEKPTISSLEAFRDASGGLRVSMNIFKFEGALFYSYLKNCPMNDLRCEKELPTALLNMISDYPNSTMVIPISEHVPDLTSKEDINVMKTYVKEIDLSNW